MDVVPLRLDTLFLNQTRLASGLYFIADSEHELNPSAPKINTLTRLDESVYFDSADGVEKELRGLPDIVASGDILMVSSNGSQLRTFLTRASQQNTILVTEACENLCVFCSQPPKHTGHIFAEALTALHHFAPACTVGITGGEPTLYWDDFLDFCTSVSSELPTKSFHVLSHGRNLSDPERVAQIVETGFFERSYFGIPLHGHTSMLHDAATQRGGSFHETVNGLINLSFCSAPIEVRVIVTRQNFRHLKHIANFITTYFDSRNVFVAFMQLEPIGWAKANYRNLFVEPNEVTAELSSACENLQISNFSFGLYNYPYCQIPSKLRKFAHRSISDWKNYFPQECTGCIKKNDCCGFFASAVGPRLTRPKPIYEEDF
jgi:His-Xaa-Ser system radical SAM maturase HxsC